MELRVHDSTLRKGDETPGALLSTGDRLALARALSDAGVDVIEAGFPAASPRIAAAVAGIATGITDASIAAFARLDPRDIDLAWAALKQAHAPRLVTGIALSDEHLSLRLRQSQSSVLDAIERLVRRCATHTARVTFIAEDATRADRDFLVRALERAAQSGADVLVVADTVGYSQPDEYADLIRYVRERVPSWAVVGAQCSNDLGLAVANSLAAVRAGATEIHTTVNGIGPRAGLCALEEVGAALRVRSAYYGAALRVRTETFAQLSERVATATALPLAPNKPVVGRNAFLHEAGAHQAGVLVRPSLYEIIPAPSVGRTAAELHLGRQSGRRALASRCAALGFELTPAQLEAAYLLFLSIANETRRVEDAQIAQIATIVVEAALATAVRDATADEVPAGPLCPEPRAAHTIQGEFIAERSTRPLVKSSRTTTG